MISIYRKIEESHDSTSNFEQAFIEEGEEVPEGWTTNLDEMPKEFVESDPEKEQWKQQNEQLLQEQKENRALLLQMKTMISSLMEEVINLQSERVDKQVKE